VRRFGDFAIFAIPGSQVQTRHPSLLQIGTLRSGGSLQA
jgi:hypothetical protein